MRKYIDSVLIGNPTRPAPGALIYVYITGTDQMTLAVLYDEDGEEVDNPVVADVTGGYSFFVNDGSYDFVYFALGRVLETLTDIQIVDLSGIIPISSRNMEQYGVVGGSGGNAAANTAAINAALAAGYGPLTGTPGERYNVAPHVLVPSDSGFIEAYGAPYQFYMPAANFTNVGPTTTGSTTGALFYLNGGVSDPTISNVLFEGFQVESQTTGGRCVSVFYARNINNFQAAGIEIFGLPNGYGFYVDSLKENWWINECYIHDFYDNSIINANGISWPSMVQSTGIMIDNDRPGGPCDPGRISANKIYNIMKGDAFAELPVQGGSPGAPLGMQTDGINICSYTSSGHTLAGNVIDTVDEGIDCFGSNISITGTTIHNAYSAGLKFIHDAQGCAVSGFTIKNAGRTGIVIAGGATRGSRGNTFAGGSVEGTGYNDVWAAYAGVAAVRFECAAPGPGVNNPSNNSLTNVSLILDSHCEYGWLGDADGDATLNNYGRDITIIGTPSQNRIAIPASGGGYRNGGVMLAGGTSYITDLV